MAQGSTLRLLVRPCVRKLLLFTESARSYVHPRCPDVLEIVLCPRPWVGLAKIGVPEGDLLGVGPLAIRLRCDSLDELPLPELLLFIGGQEWFGLPLVMLGFHLLSQALLLFFGLERGLVVDKTIDLTTWTRYVLFPVVEALAGGVEARSSCVSLGELPGNMNWSELSAILFASVKSAAVPCPEISCTWPRVFLAPRIVNASVSHFQAELIILIYLSML